MITTVKVFEKDGYQCVLLPKKFHIEEKQVRFEIHGSALFLFPKEKVGKGRKIRKPR